MSSIKKPILQYDEYSFGKFIRQRRNELGYSCRALATKLGMSAVYLSDLENGNRKAPVTARSSINYMDALITGSNVSVTINFIEPETFEGEAVLDGNTLTMSIPAKDEYSSDSIFTMNVLEDGMIALTTELFSEPATFYLEQSMMLD